MVVVPCGNHNRIDISILKDLGAIGRHMLKAEFLAGMYRTDTGIRGHRFQNRAGLFKGRNQNGACIVAGAYEPDRGFGANVRGAMADSQFKRASLQCGIGLLFCGGELQDDAQRWTAAAH